MNDLHSWMRDEARNTAEKISCINSNEVMRGAAGGFGMRQRVNMLLDTVKAVLFPSLYETGAVSHTHLTAIAEERLHTAAEQLLSIAMDLTDPMSDDPMQPEMITLEFMKQILPIREVLTTDLEAAYIGDPAARSVEEILLSYPSVEAVSTYRIAHELYKLGLPMVARIMSETAHAKTGIDIHPGATIGSHFFIDHGTGVVIGETCVIGNNVKLYQGVTLGAKSFELDDDGNPVKGVKRHPNIEDDVVIYAGATILGGDVTVGKGCVVGGNAWITRSVPEYTMVFNPAPATNEKRVNKNV
jgi:serine O-acetyltransferase